MSEKDLKLTDLDYATGDHHLQMMKAALPYLDIRRQRSLSMFIRAREMMHTMEFFRENDDGMMSVCSLESPNPSVEDMLSAVRPYANKAEPGYHRYDLSLSCQPPRTIRFRAHSGTAVFHSSPGYAGTIRNPQLVQQSFAPGGSAHGTTDQKDPGNRSAAPHMDAKKIALLASFADELAAAPEAQRMNLFLDLHRKMRPVPIWFFPARSGICSFPS